MRPSHFQLHKEFPVQISVVLETQVLNVPLYQYNTLVILSIYEEIASECCHPVLIVICKQPFSPTSKIYLHNLTQYATHYFPISAINLVLLHTSVFLQCILLFIYESSSNGDI
mgnify:CR=1 FL=1